MSCAARYSETTSLEFILNPFEFFFTTYVAKSRRTRLVAHHTTWPRKSARLQSLRKIAAAAATAAAPTYALTHIHALAHTSPIRQGHRKLCAVDATTLKTTLKLLSR
jgi:hypothetical protein